MRILSKRVRMSLIKVSAIAVLIVTLTAGCDDFGNLNVDPNNPSVVKTELLLTTAQRGMSDVIGAVTGVLYVQYLAETQYTDASQYTSTTFDFNPWYTGPLQDLQTIIELNTNEATRSDALSGGSNNNQIAVARILKVYYFQMMTDRWGMIPYSAALQGNENLSPVYDTQESIYMDLINELKEAVTQMDGGVGVRGDILFGGDMEQWEHFANSLRMRVAIRLSDAAPTVAAAEFSNAYNAGIITEDVMYPYLAEASNENPWYNRFRTRTDYAISDVMTDALIPLEDYRITKYANPAADLDDGDGTTTFAEIVGMPYGAENAGDIPNAAISFPGSAIGAGGPGVGEQDANLPIITLAELNLSLAEAVERGWVSGNAEQFYNAGIEASWRQWDVYDDANFSSYMAQPEVAYSSAQWREKIGFQKWIALFPLGYEAWAEWRRLGEPNLDPHPFALNNSGLIPVRHAYPTTEAQLNKSNYDSAVASQGPDTGDTRLWWDVN
jgi:hypothetical protein